MNDEMERIWKKVVQPNLRYYTGIFMERLSIGTIMKSEHYVSIIKLCMPKIMTRYEHAKAVPATGQRAIQTKATAKLGCYPSSSFS
jgi:hypothetical protein